MVLARFLSPRSGLAVAAATLLAASVLAGCADKSESTAEQKPKYRPADVVETEVASNDTPSADQAADSAAPSPSAETSTPAPATPAPSAQSPSSVPMTPPPTTVPTPDVDRGPAPGAKGAKNVASTPSSALKVPEGGVPELLAFIDELSSRQPRGSTQQEQVADFQQIQNARLAACQKVLELTDDDNVKMTILQAMQEVYTLYAQLQLPGALPMMRDFANRSAKSEDKIVSQYGRLLQFQLRVMDLAAQPTASGDAVIGEIKTFLESIKDAEDDFRLNAFTLAASATELLEQQGQTADAVRALRLIADEMRKSDLAQLVDTAPLMEARANVVEANLSQLADDVLKEQPGAGEKIVAAVNKLLGEKDPPINYVSAIQQVATLLEFSGNTDLARQIYTSLSDAYKDHKSEKTAKIVSEMTANALKRLDLPGKPFEIEGVLIGGEPFDWAKYRGKWVLVDFWATWCEPCLREMPNIRRNYEEFKDKGFEVVGVNMNTDPQELERFFALQELPWPTVVSQEVLDKQEFPMWNDLPMAKKYGVDAIPFVVLVNKEGKVDSLHLRGPKLTARLNELFGEGEKEEPAAEETTPKTSSAAPRKPAGLGQQADRALGRWLGALKAGPAVLLTVAAEETESDDAKTDEVNPYSAKPGLSATELERWLEKMLDKPKSIQARPGFAAAVAEGCDRLLAMKATDSAHLLATETKLNILHDAACNGNDAADAKLAAFVRSLAADDRPKVQRAVAFYALERKVLGAADGPVDAIEPVLHEVHDFAANQKLGARHLRLASATVALVNRIDDGDKREEHFATLGELFAKSSDKELARYGRKLAKKPAAKESDLVGKPMELAGTTAGGIPLVWDAYRGKVVLVDFWATWCGPCRREMPHVKELYEKHKAAGFEVVGVSVDKDHEALAEYLEENQIAWPTLAGDETEELANKYGVRGIPTMMLVDRDGKIIAVAHRADQLTPHLEKLLAANKN